MKLFDDADHDDDNDDEVFIENNTHKHTRELTIIA